MQFRRRGELKWGAERAGGVLGGVRTDAGSDALMGRRVMEKGFRRFNES